MKILFIGSVEFSRMALEKMISMKENVIGVICKESSSYNSDFYNLASIAQVNNIPYHYSNDINSVEVENWIKKLNPNIIYCFGWSQIINEKILRIPELGVIGFHPAELPYNKGRHPIIWALFLGLKKTASSFFFMDKGPDTGDIISQKEVSINELDDAKTLYQKITKIALEQIEEFTVAIKNNNCSRIPQDKKTGNSWRKRSKNDGRIDWRMNSDAIFNLVRALAKPYLGAHLLINDTEYKIWKVEKIETNFDQNNFEPGKVLYVNRENNTFDVKTYDGVIKVLMHEINDLSILGDYLL